MTDLKLTKWTKFNIGMVAAAATLLFVSALFLSPIGTIAGFVAGYVLGRASL